MVVAFLMNAGMTYVSASFRHAVEPQVVTPSSTDDEVVLMKALGEALDSAPMLNTVYYRKGGRKGFVEKHQGQYVVSYADRTLKDLEQHRFNSEKEAFQKLKECLLKPNQVNVEPSTGWPIGSDENMIDRVSDQNTIKEELLIPFAAMYQKTPNQVIEPSPELLAKNDADVEKLSQDLQSYRLINKSSLKLTGDGDAQVLKNAFNDDNRFDSLPLLNKMFYGGMGRQGWVDNHPFDSQKYIMAYLNPYTGYQYQEFDSKVKAVKALQAELWPWFGLVETKNKKSPQDVIDQSYTKLNGTRFCEPNYLSHISVPTK